jgi:hypothetical protein
LDGSEDGNEFVEFELLPEEKTSESLGGFNK